MKWENATAVNDAIRKIFGFNRWESIRHLHDSFGYKSLYNSFALAKRKFDQTLANHSNVTLKQLYSYSIVDMT